MASRPAFLRHDTDTHGAVEVLQNPGDAIEKPTKYFELQELDLKKSRDVESNRSDEDSSSGVDAGDGFTKVDAPIETAKDLVTNVIHVDDDPNLNPYTFRLLFLGTFYSPM